MRKSFGSHSEVCHIWAQENQAEGSAGNIFFEGAVIYSYGRHYKMACIHGGTVLINSSGYSNSTAKHTCHVRSAVSHYNTINVPLVQPQGRPDHLINLKHFAEVIEGCQKKAVRATKNGEYYIREAEAAAADYNSYISLFSLKLPEMDVDSLFDAEAKEKAAAQVKKESETARARRIKDAQEAARILEAWKSGKSNERPYTFNMLPVFLRVYDGEIQTSHGARVEVKDALLLVRALRAGRDVTGFEFGSYTVTRWDDDILIIGCHRIERVEVMRMCALLMEGVKA